MTALTKAELEQQLAEAQAELEQYRQLKPAMVELAHAAEEAVARPAMLEARVVTGLDDEQTAELRAPLDPGRIKSRQGRGSGKFEYLAGHDVIRTANELFGFGKWGHEIVEQTCEEAVAVANDAGREGWHIAYRCVVRVTIEGCVPMSGSGYGDAIEYGPAAKATARELALKESETDALKRALKNYGDQFGLSLYEKDTDRRRAAQEQPAHRPVRAHDPERPVPKSFAEINERLEKADPNAGWQWWIRELVGALYGGAESVKDLSPTTQMVMGQKLGSLTLKVEDAAGELGLTGGRDQINRLILDTFADLKGVALDGPPWRLGPEHSEDGRPTLDEYLQLEQERHAASDEELAGEVATPAAVE